MGDDPYRRVAAWYDRVFEPMNGGLRAIGLKMHRPEPGMRVLDVGCGTGVHLERYRRLGCTVAGVDTSPSMLGMAQTRLGREADLRLADGASLPFESGTFDLVVAMLLLHELHHPQRLAVLQEMRRVSSEGGRLLLIDFHPGPLRPIRGWVTRGVIFLTELLAGGDHFRNYRHFMAIRGLPALIRESALEVEKERVVSGGAMVLYLLKKR